MNRSTRRRSSIWQSAFVMAVLTAGLTWATYKTREPLQRIDLQIAAQSLHSYAAEGAMLAEQYAADAMFRRYLENEAQFLSEKVEDIVLMLSDKEVSDESATVFAQERAAAQNLRLQLNTVSKAGDPAQLRSAAVHLSQLSSQLAELARRLAHSQH
jgi:hypothetical protein